MEWMGMRVSSMFDKATIQGSGLIKCHRNGNVTIKYRLGKADWMDYNEGWGTANRFREPICN